MKIDVKKYLIPDKKGPKHEKAATVNLFLDFIGGITKDYPYEFWLRRVGKCTYGQALEILKSLETLPLEYNKAGTIMNRLKKLNGIKPKNTEVQKKSYASTNGKKV